jgi:hypothetical protein
MRKAKILFVVASLLVILGGVLHFVGQFGGKEEGRNVVIEEMKNYKIPPQTGQFSLWDVMQAFGVGLGASIIWYGILNLALADYLAERPAMLRNAALVNAAAMLTFALVVVYYRIFPPAAVMTPSWIAYLLAAIFAPRQRPGASPSPS